ncbi:Uncharacterised protein [uncultured archaeon]|nr:Uncharacterised protein [uncultured archaeon]
MLKIPIILFTLTCILFAPYISMRCPLQQYSQNPSVQVVEILNDALVADCSITAQLNILGPETNLTISNYSCYSSGEYFFNYTLNTTGLYTFTPIVSGAKNGETCRVIVINSSRTTIPDSNYLSIIALFIICAAVYLKKSSLQGRQE